MIRQFAVAGLIAGLLPLSAADVPRQAMDLALNLDNGQHTQLSAYRGKVVALIFILTTCSHCQAATRALEKVYSAEKRRGFEVIAVAIDQGAKNKLAAYRNEQHITYPLAADAAIVLFNFMQLPIMVGPKMPQLAFIDRDGMIRAQYPGESPFFNEPGQEKNMRAEVAKLLGPASRPAARKSAPKRAKRAGSQ
ncbi:MAG: TlpA family protein disulfide reductase [Bryobacterales bacterium]|nr:TlpA family protein disulfide reductase [Bryobacterales bacterium]